MSGRLVILPHKSWNVWNLDNREKVLRDERLHREKIEADNERDRKLLQEQSLTVLRNEAGVIISTKSEATNDQNENADVKPFRLFEDLERKHFDGIGNEDYMKEKKKKEDLQKKRDGLVDWALGEGSRENTGIKPWYEIVKHDPKQNCYLEDTELPQEQNSKRKIENDPMAKVLHLSHKIKKEDKVLTKEKNELVTDDQSAEKKRKHDRKRRDRSPSTDSDARKKRKESKREKHSKDKEHKSRDDKDRKDDKQDGVWEEVRRKRLEREAVEKKRATLLLAQQDVYGGNGASSSSQSVNRYSSQYHPHLARKYF